MTNVTRFLTRRLKLKVNEAKSAVARPEGRARAALRHQPELTGHIREAHALTFVLVEEGSGVERSLHY